MKRHTHAQTANNKSATLKRATKPKPLCHLSTMRLFLLTFVLIAATSYDVYATGPAADQQEQVCSASDYEDGTCTQDQTTTNGHNVEEEDDDDLQINCQDVDDKCTTLKEEGACQDNPGYMTHNCPVSCDTCHAVLQAAKAAEWVDKNEFSKPCMDDDSRCLEWSGMGECDANPNYMLKSCRHSCMMCDDGTNQFGIGQRLPPVKEAGDVEKHEMIKARINQSIEYMRKVWSMDDKYARVRHKCKNQHQDCTFWAALGECDANPKYMQTNCAPACETCDLLDISHRCPIEPGNECIWNPGDLNKLMEAIVDNVDGKGEYAKYNPIALSRPKFKSDGTPSGAEKDGPWVVSLSNFVTHEEADRLVEIGRQQGYERSADVGKEKPDGSHESSVSDSRTSHNTWCQEKSCYGDPLVAPVIDRIANVTKTKVENSEYLQLLQYDPGQYYKQHHDYIGHHKGMPCGVRILTLFIYLNDVEAGGGTHFPLLPVTVMPKKGNAVLWPSVLDGAPESKDGRTDHEALPVEAGIKYGANAWIHSRNFKEAFERNCH